MVPYITWLEGRQFAFTIVFNMTYIERLNATFRERLVCR